MLAKRDLQRRYAVAAATTFLGILPVSASAQSVFTDRASAFLFDGVAFPSVVDTFAVMQTVRYPDRSLGVAIQYLTPLDRSARLDLYVYPVRSAPGAEDEVLRAEFDLALRGIAEYATQNPRSFQVISQLQDSVSIMDTAGQWRSGWRAESAARERGIEQTSFLYVFIKDGSYFKYRISYASAIESTMRPRVERFVATTLAEVSTQRRQQ